MLTRLAKWSLLVGLAVMVLGASASAQSGCANGAPCVALGTDYLQTQPGSNFNFGPGIGVVNFMGLPIGPGNTDTTVQRQSDADINGGSIPIQITALSMESTAPVNVGGSFFDVFVTLDPKNLGNDRGSMSIMGSLAGGTFTSSFNVFFEANFVPVGGGSGTPIFNNILLSNGGSAWSPTPPPSAVIVKGPFRDQSANTHAGLPANFVDFFPCSVAPCTEDSSGAAHHVVQPATTPEPSTFLLLGPAGIGLLWKLRAWRSARV